MAISSAALFRALTTSNINDVSRRQALPDSEQSIFHRLATGVRSWCQTEHREHKKNEFSVLTHSILDEFAKNENSALITITMDDKNLVASEYPDSVKLVFGEKTHTLENMTLKDFVTRLRVDRAVNAELYGILEEEKQRPGDAGLTLAGANLRNMNLSGANLKGADLTDANLHWSNLQRANLSGTDLSGTNLRGANLSGANLSGANLSGANLSGTDLRLANLFGANLSGANLKGAKLKGAYHLSEANLEKTHLSRANPYGANLKGTGLYRFVQSQSDES